MAAWKDKTIPALDFESTGLDPLADRIVQVALVFVGPGGTAEPRSWTAIVDPGVEIPAEASAVHGITAEIAKERGIPPAEALRHLSHLLGEIAAEKLPLVIYNAPYDWPLLLSEARRHDVTVPKVPIIDPLVCDQGVDRYRRGRRTLDNVARHYGCSLENAHDARADAVAAAAIARTIAHRFPAVGDSTLAELQTRQADWYRRRARSLSEYRGRPVDEGWPLPERAADLRSGSGG